MIGQKFKTNCDGVVEIIKTNGNLVTVKFINTGYERDALLHNVRNGKVRDHTVKRKPAKIKMDERVESNGTGWLTILEKEGKMCTVQFDETGYTTTAYIDNVRQGKIKDPYYPSVYGKGHVGEFDKKSYPYWKQAKQLWSNMMKRCYSSKDPRGYYGKGVEVDVRWLCFATFLDDISELENFDKWLVNHGTGNRYNLDKDLKVEGNKIYSKELCAFVSEHENKSAGALNSLKIHGPIHLR